MNTNSDRPAGSGQSPGMVWGSPSTQWASSSAPGSLSHQRNNGLTPSGAPYFVRDMVWGSSTTFGSPHTETSDSTQMMNLNNANMQMQEYHGFQDFQGLPVSQPFPNQNPNTGTSLQSSQSKTDGLQPFTNSSGFDPQKEQYTRPSQPMKLPDYKFPWNPNAPDFLPRSYKRQNEATESPGLERLPTPPFDQRHCSEMLHRGLTFPTVFAPKSENGKNESNKDNLDRLTQNENKDPQNNKQDSTPKRESAPRYYDGNQCQQNMEYLVLDLAEPNVPCPPMATYGSPSSVGAAAVNPNNQQPTVAPQANYHLNADAAGNTCPDCTRIAKICYNNFT